MIKHTKGPWKVDKKKKHPWVVTCTDKNLGCQNKLVEVWYKPNAYLIASARNAIGDNVDIKELEQMKFGQLWDSYKELLEVCKGTRDFLSQHECSEQSSVGIRRKTLDEAIAKAEVK